MGSLALNAGKEGCTCTQFIEVSMASQLSGPNIEEEYLWSVTLDDKTKQFSWSPNEPSDEVKDDDDENFKPNHRLLIKTAILHPDSAKDEVTMLEIETNGYKKEKVKAPFLAMKSGLQLQQYVDILLPDTATIKITAGKGPITLVGSHCVDYYDYRNYGGDEEDDDEECSEDDEMDEEEQEATTKEDSTEDKNGKKTSKKEETAKKEETKVKEKVKSPKDGKSPPKEESKEDSKKRKSSDDNSQEKKTQ